jgi:alginate O-acetyltransferase complex protein AlgI
MLFTEFRFFWFFLAVFAVYWSLRGNTSRKFWLLICSYVFYAAWNWKFLFLLIASSALDYIVGVALARTEDPRARRGWIALSLTANLGVIAFFKYYNFFVTSLAALLEWLGLPASIHTLNIVIPVGVSFYTFHSMSYTLDVYRRKMPAVMSALNVFCFIGFFPQMVAGPIVRGALFLPQLQSLRRFSDVDVRGALVLFLTGFIKKACVADGLAPTVDRYFEAPWNFDAASGWVAVLYYAAQIYCDFSGYTDMAIATAALLGYKLPVNFRFPYFATNMTGFWQRWHISLSTWLRDYLFLSLGGGRGPRWFGYRNILITMILGGLWHGAAWTFVIFGSLHGVALVAQHEWKHWTRKIRLAPMAAWLGCVLTFYWVCLSMVFFRAGDMSRVGPALRSFVLFTGNGVARLGAWKLAIFFFLAFIHWLNSRGTFSNWWRRGSDPLFAFAYGGVAAIILVFVPTNYTPFIYFQF